MFSLDDRTGNVLTTIGLFAAVAGTVFAARATVLVFVLALLLAYLLEPAVAWVQGLLPSQSYSRTVAIAVVYLIGALLVVGAGYTFEPAIAGQLQRLDAAVPEMRARFADHQLLARHSSEIGGAVERVGQAVAAAAEQAGWLLTVPIIAVFFLKNRAALIDGAVDVFARRRDRASVKGTIEQLDTMLAQYSRAQLATAGLSVAFYSGSMALLGFPYPLALGVLGGALEFLPVGMKPTIRVNHAVIYTARPQDRDISVVAIKQLYASHYFHTALDLSVCVDDMASAGPRGFYLLTLKGSEQEGLTGVQGSMLRKIVVDKTRSSLESALADIKRTVEQAARGSSD